MCRDAVVHVRLVVPMIQLIQWQASKQASELATAGGLARLDVASASSLAQLAVCLSSAAAAAPSPVASRRRRPVDYTCSFVLLIVVCAGFVTSCAGKSFRRAVCDCAWCE